MQRGRAPLATKVHVFVKPHRVPRDLVGRSQSETWMTQ
jgi:hypothetical protein